MEVGNKCQHVSSKLSLHQLGKQTLGHDTETTKYINSLDIYSTLDIV